MLRLIKGKFTKKDLREAYELYFESLRNFLCYKTKNTALAEDLVQEVFIKLWDKRDSIEKKTLKSLLFTMANNMMLNHFEHQKVVQKHTEAELYVSKVENETPVFKIEEKEFKERFNTIIDQMTEGSREVFLMNRIEKLKYSEIAERLNISVKAVEKRMSVALKVIKEELGRKV